MLAKLGCTYVVVGHSERRTLHGETDEIVRDKTKAALRHGLTPIVCIGEGLDVREAGSHVEYNVEQLKNSLAGLSADEIAKIVVAYEPVWAIGTGKVASAADAQEVCAAVRNTLAELASPEVAASVRVLYGGSVNAKNVGELIAQTDIDGARGRRLPQADDSLSCRRSPQAARSSRATGIRWVQDRRDPAPPRVSPQRSVAVSTRVATTTVPGTPAASPYGERVS